MIIIIKLLRGRGYAHFYTIFNPQVPLALRSPVPVATCCQSIIICMHLYNSYSCSSWTHFIWKYPYYLYLLLLLICLRKYYNIYKWGAFKGFQKPGFPVFIALQSAQQPVMFYLNDYLHKLLSHIKVLVITYYHTSKCVLYKELMALTFFYRRIKYHYMHT